MKKTKNEIKVTTKVASHLETQLKKNIRRKNAFQLTSLAFFSLIPILGYHDIHNLDSKKQSKVTVDMTYWKFLGKFTLWCFGLMFAVVFGTGFLGLSEDEKADMRNIVARVLDDKKLAQKLNLELIKISPVLKSMYLSIFANSEDIGKKLLNGELTERDEEIVTKYMDEYLTAHPNEAEKFLTVLGVAQLPQDVIDRYILKYVRGTISFNMARSIQRSREYEH